MSVRRKTFVSEFSRNYNRLATIAGEWLAGAIAEENTLAQAMNYSLLAGGKRIRPVLALAVGEALNVDLRALRSVCIALECIHTASLIHDDLPAMDNDGLRRGKPTCHIVFGEGIALLAGDGLISKAFQILSKDEIIDRLIRVELVALLAESTVALCDGQVLDLQAAIGEQEQGNTGQGRDSETLLRKRHLLKTGALIAASCLAPACFLPVEFKRRELTRALQSFGNELGLLFQITDDILGISSTTEKLGKEIGSDERKQTPTYVSVYGLERARELARETAETAQDCLRLFGGEAQFLRQVVDFVLNREN